MYHIVYKNNKKNQTNSFHLIYLKTHIGYKSLALKTNNSLLSLLALLLLASRFELRQERKMFAAILQIA